jgi:Kef-type K+ transport system membrane component KefB
MHLDASMPASTVKVDAVIGFLYHLGMLLLMFLAGAESRGVFAHKDVRGVAWVMSVGTGLPFLGVLLASAWLPLNGISGQAGSEMAVLLVMGIAAVVTSIPVISRIFHDLGITHTPFARLVLGVAVIEDTLLWVVLAIATALAQSGVVPRISIAWHVGVTILYFAVGLTLAPWVIRRLNGARWNFFVDFSPLAYMMTVLLAYAAIAAMLDVNLVFAAFLAGFAVNGDLRRFTDSVGAVAAFSFAVFIPIYFALVGLRLDFKSDLSVPMLAAFLFGSCLLKLGAVSAGGFLAGFRGRSLANLAIAANARGGPGIVVASVALDAGIINPRFYTALVVTAILTSQAAGGGWNSSYAEGGPY